MWVHPQLELPLDEPAAVSAVLTILASPTGATSVHWKLFSTVSEELIAMGATLRPSYQDAAGIATIDGNRINLIKDNGFVSDVFTQSNIGTLQGEWSPLRRSPSLTGRPQATLALVMSGTPQQAAPRLARRNHSTRILHLAWPWHTMAT